MALVEASGRWREAGAAPEERLALAQPVAAALGSLKHMARRCSVLSPPQQHQRVCELQPPCMGTISADQPCSWVTEEESAGCQNRRAWRSWTARWPR
jgi:hypothetical protein